MIWNSKRITVVVSAVGLGLAVSGLVATAATAAPTETRTTVTARPDAAASPVPAVVPAAEGTHPGTASAIGQYGAPLRETLGLSPAEDPAFARYERCLTDRSSRPEADSRPDGEVTARPATAAEASRLQEAEEYCAPLEPLPAWELDRANPDAVVFGERVVAALQAAGVTDAAIAPDGGDGRIDFVFGSAADSSSSAADGLALLPRIESQVAAR